MTIYLIGLIINVIHPVEMRSMKFTHCEKYDVNQIKISLQEKKITSISTT
jgi:hypothetical protein